MGVYGIIEVYLGPMRLHVFHRQVNEYRIIWEFDEGFFFFDMNEPTTTVKRRSRTDVFLETAHIIPQQRSWALFPTGREIKNIRKSIFLAILAFSFFFERL